MWILGIKHRFSTRKKNRIIVYWFLLSVLIFIRILFHWNMELGKKRKIIILTNKSKKQQSTMKPWRKEWGTSHTSFTKDMEERICILKLKKGKLGGGTGKRTVIIRRGKGEERRQGNGGCAWSKYIISCVKRSQWNQLFCIINIF